MNFIIRKGVREDIPRVYELVVELAIFEKEPEQVTNTVEKMCEDGFGINPIFEFLVAEFNNEIVGMSLCYYRYSTWKGKRLYLEDLIVTEEMRGKGLGKSLLTETIAMAKASNCTGLMWQVLDWNEPAIKFYEKFGVRFDKGWYNVHLDFKENQ